MLGGILEIKLALKKFNEILQSGKFILIVIVYSIYIYFNSIISLFINYITLNQLGFLTS